MTAIRVRIVIWKITRLDGLEDKPVIQYGTIASGNVLFRDALQRDRLGKDYAALCRNGSRWDNQEFQLPAHSWNLRLR